MPKIISGMLKGRTVKGYNIDGTRPTMDRVKESVFGMIQEYVYNIIILAKKEPKPSDENIQKAELKTKK
jgi:16S rRNA G966 N2-methylase RsmD